MVYDQINFFYFPGELFGIRSSSLVPAAGMLNSIHSIQKSNTEKGLI